MTGHGGKEPGSIGPTGLKEKDVNLFLSHLVKDRIQKLGYEVVMTRHEDEYVSLTRRAEIGNRDKNTIAFISIHNNAPGEGTDPETASGTETCYYPKSFTGKMLAIAIQKSLVDALGTKDRGIKERPNLAVLKNTKCPAVLVEVAFISNPQEEGLLKSTDYLLKAADAITEGFKNLFKEAV